MAKNKPEIAMNDLARKIARQRSLSEPIGETFGQDIYLMNEGWETSVLKDDPDVKCVMSCMELEAAIREPKTAAIVIPKKALVTKEKLFEIVQRNGLSKTIFVEA